MGEPLADTEPMGVEPALEPTEKLELAELLEPIETTDVVDMAGCFARAQTLEDWPPPVAVTPAAPASAGKRNAAIYPTVRAKTTGPNTALR